MSKDTKIWPTLTSRSISGGHRKLDQLLVFSCMKQPTYYRGKVARRKAGMKSYLILILLKTST